MDEAHALLLPDSPGESQRKIAFLEGEVARLQSRVTEIGAELAEAKSWQNTHRSKTVPKGRT